MTLIVPWLVLPLLLTVLSLGCGLLLERAGGARLPGALLVPLGLAPIVVVTQLLTYRGATAELATPAVVALAVAGLAIGRDRLGRPDPWPLAAAAAVMAAFAAPVVLSGEATFLGYTLLGDTAVHFVLIDHLMEGGRQFSSLPPSSFRETLFAYLGNAYPTGSQTPLGAVRPLTGADVAWAFQPYLAFLAAMIALAVWQLLTPAVGSRPLRALAALLAAQPGLVYAFALQGSVKELATVWVLTLITALVPHALHASGGPRRLLPLVVATAAGIGVISLSIAPWLGPILLAALTALAWRRRSEGWRPTAVDAGAFAVLTALLCLPSLAIARTFVKINTGVLSSQVELGNLVRPLEPWQAVGIWPRGDYRFPLEAHVGLTYALIGVALAAAVLGVLLVARERMGTPLLFLAISLIGCAYVIRRGSPWADSKALMIVSPALVMASMLGAEALRRAGRRPEAALLAAAIAGGILWTNAQAYHAVDLAPRERLAELGRVGDRLAGRGPTLYTEFEEFAKHFLRRGEPTGPAEGTPGARAPVYRPGAERTFGFPVDLEALELRYVQGFRHLVLRRSPTASRPPAGFDLASRGRYYEIWSRNARRASEHLALGEALRPGDFPPCAEVRRIARRAAAGGGVLAFVERPPTPLLVPTRARRSPSFSVDGSDPASLRPGGRGEVAGGVTVARGGRYSLWLQGSFGRGYAIEIDGRRVGEVRYQLNGRQQYAPAGEATLGAGRHQVRLIRPGGDLHPGNGGDNRLLGPLGLSPREETLEVETVAPRRWRELCGRSLDWVEVLPG